MSRYHIAESVGRHIETVHAYEDLEKHHPSSGREPGREYESVAGKLEEVRHIGGHTYIKKDLILSTDDGSPVNVPAPASGYLHYLHDATNAVRIYDKPFGTPGAVLLAQSLHMVRNSGPAEGAHVQYGAPMGRMGDTGSPGSVHSHLEMELGRFRQYVHDIDQGIIRPDRVPAPPASNPPAVSPAGTAAPLLREGDRGEAVRALQQQLNQHGVRDADNRALVTDGVFGARTQQSLETFQRSRQLAVDGIAGPATRAALQRVQAPVAASPLPATAAAATPTAYGPTPLSNLIGRGEGGYNSYNRGIAGDSRGEIDFSRLTVAEVMNRQALPHSDPQALFAVGKFQMIPLTMRETVRNLHIDPQAHLTPALQERMFADYLVAAKRPEVKAYITGDGGQSALERAQLGLSREFASVADPRTGRSYYDGDSAGNHASITANQVHTALDQMREHYRANVHAGMTPDQAYQQIGATPGQTHAQAATQEHAASPSRDATSSPILREGSRGADVMTLQQRLIGQGYADAQGQRLSADGDYGSRTREAVQSFQQAQHLTADGIAGPATLSALGIKVVPSQAGQTSASAGTVPAGDGVVSRGSEFTPERRAFMDLIAWKEVPHSLAATAYRENNGVHGSTGRFDQADVDAGDGFPQSAGTQFNVGRYQFNRGDWRDAKQADPSIKGYSAADQDKVALHKLSERHVLEPLDHGDLRTAIARAGKEWASLPGSPYGQVQHGYTVQQAVDYYNERLAHHRGLDRGAMVPAAHEAVPIARANSATTVAEGGSPSLLSQPTHPQHGLYRQAFAGVQRIDANMSRVSDERSENLAGALAASAHGQGMTAINQVILNDSGTHAFAVQGAMTDPLKQVAQVETQQAIVQPLSESSRQVALQTMADQQTHQPVPQQNPPIRGPSMA